MLKYLQLQNFRNYQKLDFAPGEGLLILSGPNGTGKSNLLESIFYLGSGYSNRQARDDVLLRWGATFFAIRGIVVQGGLEYTLDVLYRSEKRHKITKINGKRALSGNCASLLPVVIFSPQDLLLVQGSPAVRRRFLDLVVAQVRPQHAVDLHQYQATLFQRNKLLRRPGFSDAELSPWDEQLTATGTRLWKRRLDIFEALLSFGSGFFPSLSDGGVLSGRYLSRVMDNPSGVIDTAEYRIRFLEALKKARQLDRRLKVTTVGPHRDDFQLYLNGREARLYSSQGEQRLIALTLKIAQYRLISAEQKSEPLLLLDDVFSELDERRRRLVIGRLREGSQVIATMTGSLKGYCRKDQLTDNISLYHVNIFS